MAVYGDIIKEKYDFVFTDINKLDISKYTSDDIVFITQSESHLLREQHSTKLGNLKKIYIDIEGEDSPFLYNPYKNIFENWLNQNKNHYLISQRYDDFKHERAITGKHYLSLVYYFSKFKLYTSNKIELSSIVKDFKFDFIAFLGKSGPKNQTRFKLLNLILDNDLSSCKYQHDNHDVLNNLNDFNSIEDFYDLRLNILQSYQAKINIIFETVHVNKTQEIHNVLYLTEKTLRGLLIGIPSIIILNKKLITYLKSIGFKFPYDGFETHNEVKEYINNIKIEGIDHWFELHKNDFIHNSNHIWDVLYTKEDFVTKLFK